MISTGKKDEDFQTYQFKCFVARQYSLEKGLQEQTELNQTLQETQGINNQFFKKCVRTRLL